MDQNEFVWDYEKLWSDKRRVEDDMKELWKDSFVDEMKGKLEPITWFMKESDTFLNVVGHQYIGHLEARSCKVMITESANFLNRARANHFDKTGKISIEQSDNVSSDNNHTATMLDVAFSFGP